MTLPRFNRTVLACVLLLSGLGLLSLWTAAPTNAAGTNAIFYRQLTFLAVGLSIMGLAALPHYQLYRRFAWFFYALGVLALLALLFKASRTRGARGWFYLGPIGVQPAEFVKIAVVLVLARVLMYGRELQRWRGLLLPIGVTLLPLGLILVQPDLGTASLLVPTLLAMLYVAGCRSRHLAVMLLVLAVAAPLTYRFGMKEYQRNRLVSFMFPERVPADLSYQQTQSKRACAAGGATGRGLGESGTAVPFYIPDRHTDFVYSIIAEELGFAGSTLLLLILAAYFLTSLKIAFQSREPFGRLVVAGLTTLFAFQTFINVGMTLGVAPITGVTLPFVSYGGSSLLTCALSAGLVLNVSARWQPGFSSRDMAGGSREISNFQPQAVKWLGH